MNQETDTDASRILFLDSSDGINTASDQQLTTKYNILLQDPIVVPNHHTLLLSLHRLNVPRTFYNFQQKRNCGLEVVFVNSDGTSGGSGVGFATQNLGQVPYLSFEIDEGNWDAVSLMNRITTRINDYLLSGVAPTIRQPLGTIDLTAEQRAKFKLEMIYNRNSLKYEWAMNKIEGAVIAETFGIMAVFRWKTGEMYGVDNQSSLGGNDYKDTSIRQEVGFISNKWFNGTSTDFYATFRQRRSLVAGKVDGEWTYGRGDFTGLSGVGGSYPITSGAWATGIRTRNELTAEQVANNRYYFRGNDEPTGTPLSQNNYLSATDINYHTQNIYLHTSLTQHSVLDSRLGCRYSDILARIPVDVASGSAVVVMPSDGAVHKLMLKVREITSIEVRLTDLNDKLIDTNGLDWTFSLEFDFIVSPEVKVRKPIREDIEAKKYAHFLHKNGKMKELKDFMDRRENELLPNV